MGPGIGRAIREGFRAANKSWAGMGLFAGGWILLVITSLVGFAVTNPPPELFEQRKEQPAVEVPAAAPVDVAPAPSSQSADIFGQLASTESRPPPTGGAGQGHPETAGGGTTEPGTPPTGGVGEGSAETRSVRPTESVTEPGPPASAGAGEGHPETEGRGTSDASTGISPAARAGPASETPQTEKAQEAERVRILDDWFARAWPVLLVLFFLSVAASTWLYGGQVGYLAKSVTAPPAGVSEFLRAGARAFWPLLGASTLLLVVGGGFLLAILLVIVVAAGLTAGVPEWVRSLLAVLLGGGLVGWLVWGGIRLAFWFIAVVADRAGPLRGFTVSFRTTEGRWWKTCGLLLLLAFISLGVGLVFQLLAALGSAIGGAGGGVFVLVMLVVYLVGNLYIGFAAIAAMIRYYEDAKWVQSRKDESTSGLAPASSPS